MAMADHVRVAAVLRIIYSGLGFVLAAGFFLLLGGVGAIASPGLGLAFAVVAAVMLICALPSILTGWGMLLFRPWARILGIVFAAIDLFAFPIGTALGVYTLWALLHPEGAALFEHNGRVGETW